MRVTSVILAVSLLATLVAPAISQVTTQTTVVPKNTVVPVVLDTNLNSATAQVGDTFYTHCSQANCGGFPSGTTFVGRVAQVVRASGSSPGQIEVNFVQANLPDGRSVAISGMLTALNDQTVKTDPNTGRLTGTTQAGKSGTRFIAYGAAAGLVIGALTKGNLLVGVLLGAAAGYLYGRTQDKAAVGKEVNVPVGTEFGILLKQDVTLTPIPTAPVPATTPPPAGGAGAGPEIMTLTLTTPRPMTSQGVVMLPLRAVMDGMGIPLTYSSFDRSVAVQSDQGQAMATVGSRIAYLNGQAFTMGTAPRIVRGVLYVPAAFVSTATGKTVSWNPNTNMLTLE